MSGRRSESIDPREFCENFSARGRFGGQRGAQATPKNKHFVVEGCSFEILNDLESTLGDMEGKFSEDSVVNGSAYRLNRAKVDFEHHSAAKC